MVARLWKERTVVHPGSVWRGLVKRLLRRHGDIKSFEAELRGVGGLAGRVDRGVTTVPTHKIVGSVGRWRNLRSDFFYKHGKAMTDRFVRIGSAMREGKTLPPLELYKVKPRRDDTGPPAGTEYYVVDGHHRVAMARKLGQDYLDAHIVEYQLGADTGAATTDRISDAILPFEQGNVANASRTPGNASSDSLDPSGRT